jgi:uncharacterized protein
VKILIDIGHPAHVHYFKHFIHIMEEKGHEFLVVARDKEVTLDLLEKFNIPYVNRGKGQTSFLGKMLYLLKANIIIFKKAFKFKPNLFMSFVSPYAAQVSWLLRKPHIAFDDTEHAKLGRIMYEPFTNTIMTPSCFKDDLGEKQIRFNSYMELTHLHKNRYHPDQSIYNFLKINRKQKYIIFRFVSWSASHDYGQKGLDIESKLLLVRELSKYAKVFISSEGELPEELIKYKINLASDKIHDALAYASLFIGEGATMASECVMLGTPAIYINTLSAGTLEEQEKEGVLFSFRESDGILEKAIELLNNDNTKNEYNINHDKMLKDKIDLTEFMVWFVENYPESIDTIKNNANYQNRFK